MLQGLLIIDTGSDPRYQGRTFSSSVVLGICGGWLWTSGKIANTSMAKDCWRWWTRRPRIDWFNMIVKSLIHYELEKKTKDCWRGTAPVNDAIFGDPVQKAEAMAFRRAFEGIFF
ncbi:unnamed protein product [Camellia sinensis]